MSAAPQSPPPSPAPPRGRWRVLRWMALALVALVALVAGIAWWILATEGGARFTLREVAGRVGPGTRIEGVRGRLGGPLHVALIEIARPGLYVRIDEVDLDASPPLSGVLVVHQLHAKSVVVRTAPSADTKSTLPASIAAPYPVHLEDGKVETLRIGHIAPGEPAQGDAAKDFVVTGIVLKGDGDRSRWRVDEAAATTEYGTAHVSGSVGYARPFRLDAHATASGRFQEKAYDADAKVKGTLETLEADLQGTFAGARAMASAAVAPFGESVVRALSLEASRVDLAQFTPSLPATDLAVQAKLVPHGKGFRGPVRIENARPGPWDRKELPFTRAAAEVTAEGTRVALASLDVALAGGGRAQGRGAYDNGAAQADLQLTGVDLASLQSTLQKTQIGGRVQASGDRDAQRFEVALEDPRFKVEGRGALAQQKLSIETARVSTGGGVLDAKGSMALAGDKAFRLEGNAQHFDPSAFVKTTKGDLNFAFVASGRLADPIGGEARLDIAPSRYAGLPAQGRAHVAGDRTRIAVAEADVEIGGARITASGSYGRAGDALDLTFHVPNLSVLAQPFGASLSGRVNGSARVTGTFDDPAGRISLTADNLALPSDITVRALSLELEAGTHPTSPVAVRLNAQSIARGAPPPATTLAQSVRLSVDGTRLEHRARLDVAINKDSTFHAALHGGEQRSAKTVAWNGTLEEFGITGPGSFTLAGPAPLYAGAERVELGAADLKGEWGEAKLDLTRWTPRGIELKGTSPGIEIRTLARTLRAWSITRSDLVIAGDWDIRALETFEGTLDVHRVRGDLRVGEPPLPLGLQELALRANAQRGRARVALSLVGANFGHVEGDGTGLIVRGASGWQLAQDAPVEAKLVAEVPELARLTPWLGTDAKLGGRIDANIAVSGTGADPRVNGDIRATNLAVREPQSGLEIDRGEVALKLAGQSVTIERFFAHTPWSVPQRAREHLAAVKAPPDGGTLTAHGSIDLAQRTGELIIDLDHAVVTELETRFVALSGQARARATKEGLAIDGKLTADAAWVGALATAPPSPSDDVVVVRSSQPAAEPQKAGEPVQLDLRFSLGDHTYFVGRGLDARLAGDLHLVGQVGSSLRAQGAIRTVDGTYNGYGQKLAIERGVLVFDGAIDNPQLNVLALRKGLPVEAGVEVLGTTARPRVRLVSTPDVPEPEKLSWLVLGRSASDATLGDSAVLMAAAQALLGNNNPGSDLSQRLGFDEIKIGRADTNSVLGVLPENTVAGRTGQPAAADVVSVGKRINNQIQLNYEQGLAATEGTFKVAYRLTQGFELLLRAGYLPGADVVWRWTFK
jgi:translocation and assembly module TamB